MSDTKDELDRITTTSRIKRDRCGTITLTVPIGIESKIHLEHGFEVEWDIDGERLILTPKIPKRLSIQDLIAQITPDNKHEAISTGSPVGKEVW
jgi:antitoxin MazE